ncbi:hypothetical protein R84B8_02021 [Treponema sp. R8-4-B8]
MDDIKVKLINIINREEGIRMATEVLLEITNDKEEYARLCDEIIKNQHDYKDDMVDAMRDWIKKGGRIDWEKAREEDRKYFLELLGYDSAKEEIKKRQRDQ